MSATASALSSIVGVAILAQAPMPLCTSYGFLTAMTAGMAAAVSLLLPMLTTRERDPMAAPGGLCWSAAVGERSSHPVLSRDRPFPRPSFPTQPGNLDNNQGEWNTTPDKEPFMTSDLHVVFGTGAIGLATIEALAARETPVRAVSRSGRADVPDGVEAVTGDAADAAFATKAAAGAAVVYQCLNPPYTRWPEMFPPLQAAVLEGASAVGAKYVAMDNLYAYGPTDGAPLTEDLPYAATGSKGSTRAKMTSDLLQAHRSGKVRVAIGQASDYFGPRGLLSALGERVFYPAIAGKKAQVMGNPDQPHSYSYIPDIAKGLVTLADHDEADGAAWHLPNAQAITTRQFVDKIYAAAGNEPQMQAISRVMVNVLGIFNGQVRELKEMLYEFEEPYVVDSSRFESAFGVHATPLDEAIPATVEWFRAHPRK